MTGRPRIWVLLGYRRGDNNQLLALAEALKVPFETRTMSYGRTSRLLMKLVPAGIRHLRRESRRHLQPPWPDIVIGIGRRTVPVARWIRQRSQGRAKLVRLGHPRAPNAWFDLIITTRQYPVPPGENVVTLPLAMNRFRQPPEPTADERAWLNALPRPHLLLSVGGPSAMWRLDNAALAKAVGRLAARAGEANGILIVVGSPRTPPDAWRAIRAAADNPNLAFAGDSVRYAVLLNDADEHFVTADSVSMISEAVMTGKPVGLIAVQPDARGRRRIGARDPTETDFRDPRRFWADVQRRGLVGTVEKPARGTFDDPVETAVAAVRTVLGGLVE